MMDLGIVIAIKEYDELKRRMEGSQPIGKHLSLSQYHSMVMMVGLKTKLLQ